MPKSMAIPIVIKSPRRGHPLYNRHCGWSRSVLYLEVPLYAKCHGLIDAHYQTSIRIIKWELRYFVHVNQHNVHSYETVTWSELLTIHVGAIWKHILPVVLLPPETEVARQESTHTEYEEKEPRPSSNHHANDKVGVAAIW